MALNSAGCHPMKIQYYPSKQLMITRKEMLGAKGDTLKVLGMHKRKVSTKRKV